jgi:hypothetical protein
VDTGFVASRTVSVTVLAEEGVVVGGDLYALERLQFPGAQSTYIVGINNRGEMVGQWWDDDGNTHILLTTDNATYQTLDIAGINGWQMAHGINDKGQISGDIGRGGLIESFVLEPDDTLTTFVYEDSRATPGFKINDTGQSVGRYVDVNGVSHGFVKDADGSLESFDVPDANSITWALGINNSGDVVGFHDTADGSQLQGFLRTADGTFETIIPPNTRLTRAYDINDAGVIVGEFWSGQMGDVMRSMEHLASSNSGRVRVYQGFVRTPDGTYKSFSIPQAQSTSAWGINDSGAIVGVWVDADGFTHGYRITPVTENADYVLFTP